MENSFAPNIRRVVSTDGQDLKELKELLKFGFDLQNAIALSRADGKIELTDVVYVLSPLKSAGPAFQNLGNPIRRYRAMPEADRLALASWAKTEFTLPNADVEGLIEDTLDVAYANIMLVRRWQSFIK